MDKNRLTLISIIIPVYMVEDYLPCCIDSVISQTYENMEIILVDDGSLDTCPSICDEYANKDSRIKVIHKLNGGLSDARNAGLALATGEFVAFVDSDDYLGKSFLEHLYEAVRYNNADISICDYLKVEENSSEIMSMGNGNSTVYSNRECLISTYQPQVHGMEFMACGKLYRTSLFKDNDIIYPVGKIHEDIFTTYKIYYNAKIIVFINEVQYFYRVRRGSIMQEGYNPRHLHGLEATHEACVFYLEHSEDELLHYAFNAHMRLLVKSYCDIKVKYFGDDKVGIINQLIKDGKKDLMEFSSKAKMPFIKSCLYRMFTMFRSITILKLLKMD